MFARRKKNPRWKLWLAFAPSQSRCRNFVEALATLRPDSMNEPRTTIEEGRVPKMRDMFSAQILPFPVRKLQIYILLSADIDND